MIKDLAILANHLDAKGLRKEADYLDYVIRKIAEEELEEPKFKEGDIIQHKTVRNDDGSPKLATVLKVESDTTKSSSPVMIRSQYYEIKHQFPKLPEHADRVHHMPFSWAHQMWEKQEQLELKLF